MAAAADEQRTRQVHMTSAPGGGRDAKNISCWGWGGKQGFIQCWTSLGDSKDLADVIHEQPPCEASRCALMAGNKRTICCRPDDDGRYDRRRCYFEASIGASFVEISPSLSLLSAASNYQVDIGHRHKYVKFAFSWSVPGLHNTELL